MPSSSLVEVEVEVGDEFGVGVEVWELLLRRAGKNTFSVSGWVGVKIN